MASKFVSDFAKQPPKQKALVFGGIALAVGALYYKFAFVPLREKITNAQDENQALISQSGQLDGDIVKFRDLKLRQAELEGIISANQRALPSEAELPAFFAMLNRKVAESGVEVIKMNNRKDETVGKFIKVPVDFEITGSFFQLKRFFASLVPPKGEATSEKEREKDRVVSIENLSIIDPKVKNREIVMTAKFQASTFRQEDKTGATAKPKPATPPPAQPSGAGAGSATGSATSNPLPGVKTSVEGSLNQQDAKNGSAAAQSGSAPGSGSAAGSSKGAP